MCCTIWSCTFYIFCVCNCDVVYYGWPLTFFLQEQYKRDQEKLQEEWLKAQQEVAKSAVEQEEVRQSIKIFVSTFYWCYTTQRGNHKQKWKVIQYQGI